MASIGRECRMCNSHLNTQRMSVPRSFSCASLPSASLKLQKIICRPSKVRAILCMRTVPDAKSFYTEPATHYYALLCRLVIAIAAEKLQPALRPLVLPRNCPQS